MVWGLPLGFSRNGPWFCGESGRSRRTLDDGGVPGLEDLLSEFLQETSENIATVRSAAAKLRKDPADWRALDTVFRTLHGIKGACGFMSLADLQAEVHEAEELLARVRAKRRAPGADMADLVEGALERISAGLASLAPDAGGTAASPGDPHPGKRQSVNEICQALAPMTERLAADLKKSARLVVRGGHIRADRPVMAALKAALMQLLRNALDHGLEPEKERVRRGKPRTGTIRVTAYEGDGRLFADVSDDGRGLDLDALRRRALELGLIGPDEASAMDRDALMRLALAPGLSTAREVTSVSGRGIGLDAVRARLGALGGEIALSEAADGGTRVRVSLPLDRKLAAAEGPRRGRILLVDENPLFQQALAPRLREAGYEVTAVRKIDQLLSLYQAGASFDVILSDQEPPAGGRRASLCDAAAPGPAAPVVELASRGREDAGPAPERGMRPGGAAKGGRR